MDEYAYDSGGTTETDATDATVVPVRIPLALQQAPAAAANAPIPLGDAAAAAAANALAAPAAAYGPPAAAYAPIAQAASPFSAYHKGLYIKSNLGDAYNPKLVVSHRIPWPVEPDLRAHVIAHADDLANGWRKKEEGRRREAAKAAGRPTFEVPDDPHKHPFEVPLATYYDLRQEARDRNNTYPRKLRADVWGDRGYSYSSAVDQDAKDHMYAAAAGQVKANQHMRAVREFGDRDHDDHNRVYDYDDAPVEQARYSKAPAGWDKGEWIAKQQADDFTRNISGKRPSALRPDENLRQQQQDAIARLLHEKKRKKARMEARLRGEAPPDDDDEWDGSGFSPFGLITKGIQLGKWLDKKGSGFGPPGGDGTLYYITANVWSGLLADGLTQEQIFAHYLKDDWQMALDLAYVAYHADDPLTNMLYYTDGAAIRGGIPAYDFMVRMAQKHGYNEGPFSGRTVNDFIERLGREEWLVEYPEEDF